MKNLIPHPLYLIPLFLLFSCRPPHNPFADVDLLEKYLGHWQRLNFHEQDLTQVVILQKSTTQVSVQLQGNCLPNRCAWGTQFINLKSVEAGSFELTWQGVELEIRQTFSLTEFGKLQVVSEEDYVDDALDTVKTYRFAQYDTQTLYQKIGREEAVLASLSRNPIDARPGGGSQLTAGTVLLYQTTMGRYGKIQVRGNDSRLTWRWKCWNDDGSSYAESDYMATKAGAQFEMNRGQIVVDDPDCVADFLLHEPKPGERWLIPQCGASFVVYHKEP